MKLKTGYNILLEGKLSREVEVLEEPKVQLEPFKARGDVQLRERLRSFTRCLEHLKSLVEYQPIPLVLPDIDTKFANDIRERVRGVRMGETDGNTFAISQQ
jgi:hypothetical protein